MVERLLLRHEQEQRQLGYLITAPRWYRPVIDKTSVEPLPRFIPPEQ